MTSEVGRKRRCALSLLGIRLVTCFSLYTVSKVFEPPPESWRRSPGRPRTTWMKNILDDLSSLDLGICEARDLAPKNRPPWRLMSLHSIRTRSGACYYWIGLLPRYYQLTVIYGTQPYRITPTRPEDNTLLITELSSPTARITQVLFQFYSSFISVASALLRRRCMSHSHSKRLFSPTNDIEKLKSSVLRYRERKCADTIGSAGSLGWPFPMLKY